MPRRTGPRTSMYAACTWSILPVLGLAWLASACTLVNPPRERDLCALNAEACDPLASCESDGDGFRCTCPSGYRDPRGDGTLCRDRDECDDGSHECHALARCHNEPGGYRCTCPADYIDKERGRVCEPPDPCLTGGHDCRPDSEECLSLGEGAYECACREGFEASGERCADIDECATGAHDCLLPAQCHNEAGGYRCACPPGARASDARACELPDPCDEHDCGEGARCVATGAATYECRCSGGYRQRTDSSCADVDECLDDPCEEPALCENRPGSYECVCPSYYALADDGVRCLDRRLVRAEALETARDTARDVVPLLDADGDLFVVGTYERSLDVCNRSLDAAGSRDLFVAKYDSRRVCQWLIAAGAAGEERFFGATLDARGDLILTAGFQGELDLGGVVADSGGHPARVVAKLDGGDGSGLWARTFHNVDDPATLWITPRALAVDPSGDVLWADKLRAGVDLNQSDYRDVGAAAWHALLVRLDGADGHLKRWQTFESLSAFASGVAVDEAGEILVSGIFAREILIDGELIPAAVDDLFYAKLSPDFTARWTKTMGANVGIADRPLLAAAAPGGDFVLAGDFRTLADPPITTDDSDVLVTRIDGATGERRWTRTFGSDGYDALRAVAVDAQERVFVTGNVRGPTDFGQGLVAGIEDSEVFVVSYDGQGALRWWQLMGNAPARAQGLALGAGGELALTALLSAPPWLGTSPLPELQAASSCMVVELLP